LLIAVYFSKLPIIAVFGIGPADHILSCQCFQSACSVGPCWNYHGPLFFQFNHAHLQYHTSQFSI